MAGAALALLALAACGSTPSGQGVAAGGPVGGGYGPAPAGTAVPGGPAVPTTAPAAPAGGPASAAGPLPTLPPAQRRDADRYDAQGCTRAGPDRSLCSSTAAQADATAAGDSPDDWRTLAGFVGPQYTTDLRRGSLTLLEPTVTVTTAGPWRATGLARSERADTVAGVRVTATLLGPDGAVLERVSADSPVAPVRPGEPVPFTLTATTPAASVARVQWGIEAVAGAPTGTRELQLATYWTRPTSAGDRVDMYLHRDPASGPLPHLVFGSVSGVGSTPAARPTVVLAWLDGAGRVVAVATSPVSGPDGAPIATVGPGEAADFLAEVADPGVAAQIADLTPMLWAAGR